MGARLVTQALSPGWASLSDTARLVLIVMCQTARDQPTEQQPARQYFAGHDTLVLILTGQDPTDPDWRSTPAYRTAARRIKRAISELVDAEAIELLQPAYRGRHAYYLVTPDRA